MEVKVNVFAPTAPHPKQLEVLKALDGGARFVLLRAGRKWRKTSLIVSWLFENAMKTGLTCPYVAPSKIQAKNIAWNDHIQRILDELRIKGVPYRTNEVELSVTLGNGGKIQLFGVENKEGLRGISNWGAIGCDEYDDWDEDIWPTIIRPNLMVHKAPVIIAGTPKGFRNLYRLENSGLFKAFHYQSHDNPDLDPGELEALIEEYKQMGMGYYRQEILAEYEKPQGVVYEEWDMQRQYLDFGYDPNLPVELFWDFGVNDPTAIGFVQPFGNEIRLFDYYEASNANIEHFAQVIASKGYKTPAFEAGDIAGNSKELVSGKSPISELSRLGHHIRTSPIPSIPIQIRNAHKYIPRLYVSKSNPNCERFVHCIVNYRYPEKSTSLVNQDNEKPVHDEYSHAMRGFEYYCWNKYEPSINLDKKPPANSFAGIMEQKRIQRLLQEEYGE